MSGRKVMVEIVAQKKGCMMCDLAIGILEEIAPEFETGTLRWQVVDVASREGIAPKPHWVTSVGGCLPFPPS